MHRVNLRKKQHQFQAQLWWLLIDDIDLYKQDIICGDYFSHINKTVRFLHQERGVGVQTSI